MIRVLWVVNIVFPDAAKRLGIAPPVFGGWMHGLAKDVVNTGSVELAIITPHGGNGYQVFVENGIRYYLVNNNLRDGVGDWQRVVDEFKPNIVHIHGTELGYGNIMMSANPSLKYVVSIQGLVSVCYRYYLGGLNALDILRNITFGDLVTRRTLYDNRRDLLARGGREIECLKRADCVIGRTDWDFAHAKNINPKVNYRFCNESLRDEFYSGGSWSLDHCERNTIFVSQSVQPFKGVHQLIKAVALLRQEFPNIRIAVAGHDVTLSNSWSQRIRLSGYGSYLRSLINKLNMGGCVRFCGLLTAEQMKQHYLNAHVFVCPSSIENSPNSLGEAQISGVPTISSFCGGVPSMVRDGETALLYRFEEYEMLAMKIRSVFLNDELATKLSAAAIREASVRHDRGRNCQTLLNIYSEFDAR